jgi:hypothetical protein
MHIILLENEMCVCMFACLYTQNADVVHNESKNAIQKNLNSIFLVSVQSSAHLFQDSSRFALQGAKGKV